jgi:hypothetical protein
VSAYTAISGKQRVNTRVGAPLFGQSYELEVPNVIAAALQYENGVLGTLHMNSDSILDERTGLEFTARTGYCSWATRTSSARRLYLQKTNASPVEFPLTHGFRENSRGLGAGRWLGRSGRTEPPRAAGDGVPRVRDDARDHGERASGNAQAITSRFETPGALPEGFIGDGAGREKRKAR